MSVELTPINPTGAEGDITSQALIEAYADEHDLPFYAHPADEDDASAVQAGVQVGIDFAEAYANRLARVAGHTNVPLPDTSADFLYLQSLVTKLALCETFFRYGKKDNADEPAGVYGRMNGLYKQARADLEKFFAGIVDGSGAPDPTVGVMTPVPLTFGDECICDENSNCL